VNGQDLHRLIQQRPGRTIPRRSGRRHPAILAPVAGAVNSGHARPGPQKSRAVRPGRRVDAARLRPTQRIVLDAERRRIAMGSLAQICALQRSPRVVHDHSGIARSRSRSEGQIPHPATASLGCPRTRGELRPLTAPEQRLRDAPRCAYGEPRLPEVLLRRGYASPNGTSAAGTSSLCHA
jgi:hypothetical protein